MTEINGSVLLDFKRFVESTYGDHVLEELRNDASEQTMEAFKRPILTTKMYNLDSWHEMLHLFREKYGDDALANMARHLADRQLHGLFGFMAKFVSIEKLVEVSNSKFSSIYTGGSLTIDKKDDDNMTLTISGIEMSDDHAYVLQHYLERLAEICTRRKAECRREKVNDKRQDYHVKIKD